MNTGYKTYKYKYRLFEVTNGGQAIPLNNTGARRKNVSDAFYNVFQEWCKLPDREEHRVANLTNRC